MCTKNVESRIINGPLSYQPDCERDNPFKPDRTRDDVAKQIWLMRSSSDFGEFPHPEGVDFPRSLRFPANAQIW